MLNELIALERGLAEHGFAAVARHPDLSQLLKGDVLQVRLAADGRIARIDLLEGETRHEVWTLRDGKHNGFPGLKTGRGLIELDTAARAAHDDRWKAAKSLAAKRAEIERLIEGAVLAPDAGDWPKPGHRVRVAERLADLRVLDGDPNARSVPAAFERFLTALNLQPPLLHRLYDRLIERLRHGGDGWPDYVRAALVGPVALAIDVPENEFKLDAIDARQIEPVSRALAAGGANGGGMIVEGRRCALSGAETRLLEGNFPQPTLPSLGQTYLFSRNTDIRALARYGQNGPESFPVGADLVGRFSGMLAAVTSEARRGKTWRLVPTESGDGQDLFIAFVAAEPDGPAAESLIEEPEVDEEDDTPSRPDLQQAFAESATSRLLKFWAGVAKRVPGERVRVLVLRTVDPGNRKAVYDRAPTTDALYQAASEWAAAMRAAPGWICYPVFRTKKPVDGRPGPQAPLSLISLSRRVYIRGGREATDAPGVSGGEALALFLNEGDRRRRARRVLRLLLARQGSMLVGVAQATLRGQLKDFDPKASVRLDALRLISWIGALLFFLGRTKETYMDGVSFKLGQLLAAADAVHMGYCAEVRGGQVPPTLVGNSVFACAGRDPKRALAVLQTRWKPYHAWVDRLAKKGAGGSPDKEDARAWAVRRAVSQFRLAAQLCEEIAPLLNARTEPIDDAFRAELLLGYVAGVRPEKKSDTTAPQGEEIAA